MKGLKCYAVHLLDENRIGFYERVQCIQVIEYVLKKKAKEISIK